MSKILNYLDTFFFECYKYNTHRRITVYYEPLLCGIAAFVVPSALDRMIISAKLIIDRQRFLRCDV